MRFILILLLSGCTVISQTKKGFTYVADPDNVWQTPAQTRELGTGDCEDLAFLLFENLVSSGIDPDEIQVLQGKLEGEGHMLIRYKGRFIDLSGSHKYYPEFIITKVWHPIEIDSRFAQISAD